jgi:hypothetical protein
MITSAATAKLMIVLLLGQSESGSTVVDTGRTVVVVESIASEIVEKSVVDSVVDSNGVVAVIVVDALSSASKKFVTI